MAAYELIGTTLFMYMLIMSMADNVVVPVALFIMILLFGGVTGGSFNPAVTLGIYINEARWRENFCFMLLIMAS